ncbi:SNF2-related protein [Macrophomina phaseolina MS6]|uniref:SNF2-related protein n=1 Tax=Macrophomina phaseolina (strain MS6) TaxID=1126212 RepID=K2QRX6_MACPH|nr:SNF2-related protein [Macrophomina phaseolina MS6]
MNCLAVPEGGHRKRSWPSGEPESSPPSKRRHESEDSSLSWVSSPALSSGSQTYQDSTSTPSPRSCPSFSTQLGLDMPDAYLSQDLFAPTADNFLFEITPPDAEHAELQHIEHLIVDSSSLTADNVEETSSGPFFGGRNLKEDVNICYGLVRSQSPPHIRPGTLKVHKYHGQHRQIGRADLIEHDIVLTTYGTIATELRRRQGVLEHINWFRLVLDEVSTAHVIRNWSTKQFKAVSTIPAHIRWCLSGTPIQNSLEDLGALVKFLQVPILKDGNNFNTYITRKTILTVSASKSNFENLRCLLGSICLRRNKGVLPSYLNRFKEYTYPIDFGEEEKIKYTHLKKRCKRAIDMAVSGHKAKETHRVFWKLYCGCVCSVTMETCLPPGSHQQLLKRLSVKCNKVEKQSAATVHARLFPWADTTIPPRLSSQNAAS